MRRRVFAARRFSVMTPQQPLERHLANLRKANPVVAGVSPATPAESPAIAAALRSPPQPELFS